jgi:hypothetical protein
MRFALAGREHGQADGGLGVAHKLPPTMPLPVALPLGEARAEVEEAPLPLAQSDAEADAAPEGEAILAPQWEAEGEPL